MNDRVFAFMFIVIAFFVLGFTISRAVFKFPAPEKNAAGTAAIAGPTVHEIPEEKLSPPEEKTTFDETQTATTTKPAENSSAPKTVAPTVTIKQTPTGWLNVREGPAITYKLVKRVNPGETYVFLEEKFSWYKIQLDEKTEGWIASQYAKKK